MIYLAQLARRLSWKETATVFKVSWGLAHRDLTGIEAIGLDELHRGRGKKSANDITLIYPIRSTRAAGGEASEGQGADETQRADPSQRSRTARAWLLKESFEHFWSCRGMGRSMGFLDAWVRRALRNRLTPMQRAAHMLRSHRDLLGNHSKARKLYSSGVVEVLNLKCDLIKRRAYGLLSFEALQTALYHNLGDALPEPPSTH